MFLDEVKINVKGGDGGAGAVAFRREKFVPLGGPAGGDGGMGGDVILKVNPRLNTLSNFNRKRHFKAIHGKHGSGKNQTGASGKDMIIEVPSGTMVRDAESSELLVDLTSPDQQFIVASGGRGGKGNARFKTSTNQAPRMAEKGEPGQERWIVLELKLIADVGIIGVPNAGKSTLLSVVSAARPRIANYPFTTLTPNLGMVIVDDREMVLADIPGLVEGASAGIGLGHSFLRHVQRTRLLIHLLDGAGENPLGDFTQINTELALFDENLAERPQIVVLNKIDLPQAQEHWEKIEFELSRLGYEVMKISAVTHEGVQVIINRVLELLSTLPEPEFTVEVPVFRPADDENLFEIILEEDGYRVTGVRIERAAAMTYWEFDEALVRFQRILEALGIAKALVKAGVEPGDMVFIGEHSLEWSD